MKRVLILVSVAAALSTGSAARAADGPLVLDVWPGKATGDHGQIGPERVRAPAECANERREVDHQRESADLVRIPSRPSETSRGRDCDLSGRRVLEPGVGQGG